MNEGTFLADDFPELIGTSKPMRELKNTLLRYAQHDVTVLVLGDTGTGKEVIAKAIHRKSRRRSREFLALNCSALTATILDSDLFGHEKGAFTGAGERRPGLFEAANRGTLFLDEVGTATLETQAKLLRALEEKVIRRVGGIVDIPVDVRIIAATNEDLDQAVAAGRFRKDLYYRLKVCDLITTPLRDRGDDVILLANHFLNEAAKEYDRKVSGFSASSLARVRAYDWPGNVRELSNVIQKAVVLSQIGPAADSIEVQIPELETILKAMAPTGDRGVAETVFDDLINSRIPFLGFERNADRLGALAERVVNGIACGFEQFLATSEGKRAVHNFSNAHLLGLVGISQRKSGNEALLKRSLRSRLIRVLQRKREEPT